MDGLATLGRPSHYPHASYHGTRHLNVGSTQLPMPVHRGNRNPCDDLRSFPSAAPSPVARSNGSAASSTSGSQLDSYQPRHRFTGYEQAHMQSPTFQNSDNSKPSLPSLRTVLGENARSPSTNQHSHTAALQPHPREPVHDQSTYKPPSLYPNKRTRTDSGWDGQEADRKATDASSSTLPVMNSHQHDRLRAQHQYELPTLNSGAPEAYRHRQSNIHLEQRSLIHEPLSHHTSPESRGRSVHLVASPRLSRQHTFEAQSRDGLNFQSVHRSESSRDIHMEATSSSALEPPSVTHSRSPSISMLEDSARRASLYTQSGVSPHTYGPDGRRPTLLPAGHSSGYREDYAGPHGYNGPPYPYAQAFFVPSHYEYQNGKSRKRSNLPKQSTEIMKRWFDDNLQNPYPSEEQKRHFAAVAGINLTQVSNWFINHRRRCPELREKRDKGRAGSREESV